MIFKINDIQYTIREIEQEQFITDKEEDGYYFGQTHFDIQEIWLDKRLSEPRKRKALYHELMHCYIKECITTQEITNFNEEVLCDICANALDFIKMVSDDYFKSKKIMEEIYNEGQRNRGKDKKSN